MLIIIIKTKVQINLIWKEDIYDSHIPKGVVSKRHEIY